MSENNTNTNSVPAFALPLTIVIAFIGFFLGSKPISLAESHHEPSVAAENEDLSQAPTYIAMRAQSYGENATWQSDMTPLHEALPDVLDPVVTQEGAWEAAVHDLQNNRAYDGAPPTIPHPIGSEIALECLVCHTDGMMVDDRIARPPSHSWMTNCTQCHIRSNVFINQNRISEGTLEHAESVGGSNHFGGHQWPLHGDRAWEGAPPTVPHPTWMRQNCASCHGTTGRHGLRSTHPDRQNCLQCHGLNSELEGSIPRETR